MSFLQDVTELSHFKFQQKHPISNHDGRFEVDQQFEIFGGFSWIQFLWRSSLRAPSQSLFWVFQTEKKPRTKALNKCPGFLCLSVHICPGILCLSVHTCLGVAFVRGSRIQSKKNSFISMSSCQVQALTGLYFLLHKNSDSKGPSQ